MVTVRQVVDTARGWIGTRYLHQGRKKIGVDCIGLVLGVCEELGQQGYDRPEYRNYPRTPPKGGPGMQHYFREALGRPHRLAKPADIALFWAYERRREAHHIGIVTDVDTLIHTYAEVGEVVETPFSGSFWRDRFICAFTWPDLEQCTEPKNPVKERAPLSFRSSEE